MMAARNPPHWRCYFILSVLQPSTPHVPTACGLTARAVAQALLAANFYQIGSILCLSTIATAAIQALAKI
jgi:hypothetical protein